MGTIAPKKVLIDTNIWFSVTLRDWILHFNRETTKYYTNIYQTPFMFMWTDYIMKELDNTVKEENPNTFSSHEVILTIEGIKRELGIPLQIPESEIDTELAEKLVSDPKDYPIVAAALYGKVDALITFDDDFQKNSYYEIWNPDYLLMQVYKATQSLDVAFNAVQGQVNHWKKNPRVKNFNKFDLVKSLITNQCPMFAQVVQGILESGNF